jgi:diadenosine tetraphosphate (Ap4A) HIT family hydrolase
VFCVEAALRPSLNPDKINLASLGNMTPHLHWHVIPRYANDATFPKPIWAGGVDPSSAPISKSSTAWHDAIRTALIGL